MSAPLDVIESSPPARNGAGAGGGMSAAQQTEPPTVGTGKGDASPIAGGVNGRTPGREYLKSWSRAPHREK